MKKITFSGCKPSQKKHIEPHQNFTGSYEKSMEELNGL